MIGKIKTKERRSKYFNEPHIDFFQPNPLVRYYQLINDSADDRSKIIMINLVLENQIDSLLKYLIYGYTENLEARMNYNMKLILLDSFNLLPDAIFTAANCLRVIRNEFAHNLNIANYDSLPSDIIKNIKSSFQIVAFEVEKKEANSIEKQIKSI